MEDWWNLDQTEAACKNKNPASESNAKRREQFIDQVFSASMSDVVRLKHRALATQSSIDYQAVEAYAPLEPSKRAVDTVTKPVPYKLSAEQLFCDGQPNVTDLRNFLLREGRLEIAAAEMLIERALKVFESEPNILKLKPPLKVHKFQGLFQ